MGKATGPVYRVAFRRRRRNLTNYAKRLALVKGMAPRMVVRKSSRGVLVQFLEFSPKGDRVLASYSSHLLRKHGWPARCNSPTAYLCGMMAAKQAAKSGVKQFNLDIGMHTPSKGSLLFAALKGAIDSGLTTNYTGSMISDERISGAAIAAYANSLKESDEEKYKKVFSFYLRENFQPENIANAFQLLKTKMQKE